MNLTYTNFEVASAQAVVFTPGSQIAMPRVLIALLQQWEEFFSEIEPISLPKEVPADVPRIILRSPDDQFSLEISGNRATFVWRHTDSPFDEKRFREFAQKVLYSYLDIAPAKAGRLAYVITRFAPAINPAITIAEHFCQEKWVTGPLEKVEGFELHAHEVFNLADEFRVNCWTRFKTGTRTTQVSDSTPDVQKIVLVEQDSNTLSEVAGEVIYTEEQMQRFLNQAAHRMSEILQQYFPGG
jgi:hypothetical protein